MSLKGVVFTVLCGVSIAVGQEYMVSLGYQLSDVVAGYIGVFMIILAPFAVRSILR